MSFSARHETAHHRLRARLGDAVGRCKGSGTLLVSGNTHACLQSISSIAATLLPVYVQEAAVMRS